MFPHNRLLNFDLSTFDFLIHKKSEAISPAFSISYNVLLFFSFFRTGDFLSEVFTRFEFRAF